MSAIQTLPSPCGSDNSQDLNELLSTEILAKPYFGYSFFWGSSLTICQLSMPPTKSLTWFSIPAIVFVSLYLKLSEKNSSKDLLRISLSPKLK